MSGWLTFDRDVVLRAGAGTGKTHALVTLYLHLVAGATARRKPVSPSSIAAISFTEKAAADLRAKIRARMVRLASADRSGEAVLVESAAALGVALPDSDGWERALAQLGGASVGTFHGFCGALLRRRGGRIGIAPAFGQLDEAESAERLRRAAERTVLAALDAREADVEDLVDEFGYQLSPPGRGLVDALVWLRERRAEEGKGAARLDDNYAADRMALALRRAGDEVTSAAQALVARPGVGPKWQEVQRQLRLELPAFAAALDAAAPRGAGPAFAAALEELRRCAEALLAPLDGTRAAGPGVKDAKDRLIAADAALAEARRSYRAAPLSRALARLLDETERRYAEDKRRLAVLDFGDLIVRARDLLRDHPDVLAAERDRIDVLLVDEFQDTNAPQAELVELLGGPRGDGTADGAGARLLVVGDRKQSIYEFRGADVAVFTGFEEAVRARGGVVGVLGRSWRSLPALVEFANVFFARAFAATADGGRHRTVWDAGTDPLSPVRQGGDTPLVELIAVGADVPEDAGARRRAESFPLAARLASALAAGQRDLALLLRSFTHLDVYLDALRRAGVPHHVVNGRGFFEAQEVRDLAAVLRLLDDPDDGLALLTALRSPMALAGDDTLVRLRLAGLLSVAALLDGRAAAALPAPRDEDERLERERLLRFVALVGDLRRRADRLGPRRTVETLLAGTDLEAMYAATYDGEQRIANLRALVEQARAVEEAGGDLRRFVRALAEMTEPGAGRRVAQAPTEDERDDVVRVMTVHQSKGLEFSLVAVAGCGMIEPRDVGPVLYDRDAGLGLALRDASDAGYTEPARRVFAMRADKGMAESLRLLYVAATRARDRLIFSGEASRGGRGAWRTLLDELVADPVEGARVQVTPASALVEGAASAEPLVPEGDPAVARALVEAARQPPRPPPPTALTIAVTQLSDFALCPRRHHLLHVVGLGEHPAAARPPSPDSVDGDLDPLARGTLAHHLLEHADLGRGGEDLDELLGAAGYDPAAPDVAEVREHARRFLTTRFALDLAAADRRGDVHRELPFLLSVEGGHGAPVLLRGQIDLLRLGPEGAVDVVDYKHARAGDGEDYRFQLDAYALAARKLFPGAGRVRVGLSFLREADPSPRLVERTLEDDRRFESAVAALGAELFAARSTGRFPGRPVEVCRAAGCGYVLRCHPRTP